MLADAWHAVPQIARALQGCTVLDAVHVIAHGRAGEVRFGAGALTQNNLKEHHADLAAIGPEPCALWIRAVKLATLPQVKQ